MTEKYEEASAIDTYEKQRREYQSLTLLYRVRRDQFNC